MEDFNSFVKNNKSNSDKKSENKNNAKVNKNFTEYVFNVAKSFNGKNAGELFEEVKKQAIMGKQKGTLTNAELLKFKNALSPFLDAKKKEYLDKIIDELIKL